MSELPTAVSHTEIITITDLWLKFGSLNLPIGDFNFPGYHHRSWLAIFNIRCVMRFAIRL